MALTTVDAIGMLLSYSTDNATFLSIVCEVDSNVNSQMEVTTDSTKCGTTVAAGSIATTVSGNAVVNTTPDAGEGSFDEIQAIFLAKTPIWFSYTNLAGSPATYGQGWFTQLGNQNAASGTSKFTWTITANGDVSATPTS